MLALGSVYFWLQGSQPVKLQGGMLEENPASV